MPCLWNSLEVCGQTLSKLSLFRIPMKRTASTILGAIAVLAVILSLTVASIAASPPPPTLTVDVTSHRVSTSSAFDTIVYVTVPHQMPFVPNLFNLLQSFVVQSIDLTQTAPDGTVTPTNLITCSLSTTPAYPSRNTVSTCTGIFPWRVNSRAYPGSTTGIYWVGFAGFTQTGVWTFTYSVTGLYNGASTTLTHTFTINVDPPASTGPVQLA